MLLFQKRFHEGLQSGQVRLTFRRWQKPHVRAGGRYRCHPIGVLQVDQVVLVRVRDITEDDARLAGFESREALVAYLGEVPGDPLTPTTKVFRVELQHGGDGDRVEIAMTRELSADEVATLRLKLERMDASAPKPWTRETLAIIGAKPRIAASKLALELGRETLTFKVDVRKLKKLGLTQSFEVGYEVSPRGLAFLEADPVKSKKRGKSKKTSA